MLITSGVTIGSGVSLIIIQFPATVDYLVVGGGGGGGFAHGGGGGGAGGLRSTVTATGGGGSLESALSITPNTAYTVTVGAGGTFAPNRTTKGSNGLNSVFASITSTGGGGGGSYGTAVATGAIGGSGGGGSAGDNANGSGGAGTANQGYAGGGSTGSNVPGGGGGGAGAIGANRAGAAGGAGGVGVTSAIIPNYSISFNGTTQYLTANNAALALGTGNFTVEAWVYTTVSSGTQCVYDTRQTDATTTGFYFGLIASNTLLFYTSGAFTINAGTVPINTWTHIALVRVGNTFTVYLNGTSVGTATNSNNFTNTIVQIGSSSNVTSSSTNYYTGYLSNLRVVKGTAVYTSNFAVPTPPLLAITNTSLLTAQSSTIIDNSTNAVTITAIGSPTVSSGVIPTAYYAGGGGGGMGIGADTPGAGGSGGGGRGFLNNAQPAIAGTTNTGGGGGGGGYTSVDTTGAAGGSGIAMIRYSDSFSPATTTTGSPTITTTGGYRIYTWTSSGSITF